MPTFKTIECLLVPSEWTPPSKKNPAESVAVASEDAEQFIWQLSVASTQLCKALNDLIGQQSDFAIWKEMGKLPAEQSKKLWNSIRNNSPYVGMPERFARSALLKIQNIYAGWFKTQKKLFDRLNGLNRWLSIVKSDCELVDISGCELEQIQVRANELVSEIRSRLEESEQLTETRTRSIDQSLASELFKAYFSLAETNTHLLDQCAIIYLLKNGCKITTKLEDPKKFTSTCRNRRKKAQRIEKQLNTRSPRIRDLGDEALKALSDGIKIFTLSNPESVAQLADLQRVSNPSPYPVSFYSSDDLEWYVIKRKHPTTQEIEERIFVKFKGLSRSLKNCLKQMGLKNDELKKEYIFEVCCGCRDHQIFLQILQDWTIYSTQKDVYSSSSFLLKSAQLCWKKARSGISEYQPYLYCTIDYDQLTAERTELAQAEKVKEVERRIEIYDEKQQDGNELTNEQQKDLKRLRSQSERLKNPLPRPSKKLYQGNPNVVVGVSFSIRQIAKVAIVNGSTQQVLAYRSIRQLLGKDYQLLSAYRLEQARNANKRHKQQKRGKIINLSESNKGKQIDRLIAKAIVAVAQEFNAGILALPTLTGLRESIQSEIEAQAELKHPGDRSKQDNYRKQHKINVHRWSYARLIRSLKDRAGTVGVLIESSQQFSHGNSEHKAVQIALSVYSSHRDRG